MRWLALLWPLALVLAYALGLQRYVSLDTLAANQQRLAGVVAAWPATSVAAFVALYTVMVAFSLPGAGVLTVAGGLLFGTGIGAACAVVGATVGGIALFLAARYTLADWLARRGGTLLARLRAGLEREGFLYLLTLRLLPIVPFWVVNLAPALAGMRLLPFALGTLLGIIPATVLFASVGAGIGAVLQRGERLDLTDVLQPATFLPIAGLAALALLAIAYRRWRG